MKKFWNSENGNEKRKQVQGMGKANKGRRFSKELRKKLSEIQKRIGNKPPSPANRIWKLESRQKVSESLKGKKHHNWKGGITPIHRKIRGSMEYKLWRKAVFERDNYQCIWGGKEHGNKLHADHIKPFCDYPELRFAIDNGRTLCVECHKKTKTWGGHKSINK